MTGKRGSLHQFGWLALAVLLALLLYPLSLSVAALRSEMRRTDDEIRRVQRDIRYLEVEFATRANLYQLDRWNRLDFGYAPPTARQYVEGERALAALAETIGGDHSPPRPVDVAMASAVPPPPLTSGSERAAGASDAPGMVRVALPSPGAGASGAPAPGFETIPAAAPAAKGAAGDAADNGGGDRP